MIVHGSNLNAKEDLDMAHGSMIILYLIMGDFNNQLQLLQIQFME